MKKPFKVGSLPSSFSHKTDLQNLNTGATKQFASSTSYLELCRQLLAAPGDRMSLIESDLFSKRANPRTLNHGTIYSRSINHSTTFRDIESPFHSIAQPGIVNHDGFARINYSLESQGNLNQTWWMKNELLTSTVSSCVIKATNNLL